MKTYRCYKIDGCSRDLLSKMDALRKADTLEKNGHQVLNVYYSKRFKTWVVAYNHKDEM